MSTSAERTVIVKNENRYVLVPRSTTTNDRTVLVISEKRYIYVGR